jgi:hypothetical protein
MIKVDAPKQADNDDDEDAAVGSGLRGTISAMR